MAIDSALGSKALEVTPFVLRRAVALGILGAACSLMGQTHYNRGWRACGLRHLRRSSSHQECLTERWEILRVTILFLA
jgi:hypothetical protein